MDYSDRLLGSDFPKRHFPGPGTGVALEITHVFTWKVYRVKFQVLDFNYFVLNLTNSSAPREPQPHARHSAATRGQEEPYGAEPACVRKGSSFSLHPADFP